VKQNIYSKLGLEFNDTITLERNAEFMAAPDALVNKLNNEI